MSEQLAAGSPDDPSEAEERPTGRDRMRARALDLIEAALWVALLVFGSLVALAILRIDQPRDRSGLRTVVAPAGLIEAEEVDSRGRVIVLTTTREHAELKRDQIHAYGKDSAMANCSGSMSSSIEPESV